jgi:CubicO group peptidase (beta-lactamase class C family)
MIESPVVRRLSAAVLALAMPLWGSHAFATGMPAPSAAGLDRITSFFDNEVATGRIPGAVVLIKQHSEPVYLKCFGVRDVATKRAMTPDTLFALHSMTKPITSVAAMMLVDRGQMSLDDPVAKYIRSFATVQVGI